MLKYRQTSAWLHRIFRKVPPVATEITRDMPYGEAMTALADYARRLSRPRAGRMIHPRNFATPEQQRYLDTAAAAGLNPRWPFEFDGHGDFRIDNSDGYATTMLMCLCNHREPNVALEARRVLDCFIAGVRAIVRAPR